MRRKKLTVREVAAPRRSAAALCQAPEQLWQKSAQSTFPRRLAQRSTEKLLAIKIIAAYARSTGATDLKRLKKRKAADLGATRQAAESPKAPAVRAARASAAAASKSTARNAAALPETLIVVPSEFISE